METSLLLEFFDADKTNDDKSRGGPAEAYVQGQVVWLRDHLPAALSRLFPDRARARGLRLAPLFPGGRILHARA